MTFEWPTLLWLLLALPALLSLRWLAARRRRRSARAYADAHLLPALVRGPSPAHARWLAGLQTATLALLLVAAARPVAAPPLPVNKAAVVIALDASRSMLADDVAPSRLEAARELALSFVRQAPASTRIGLVSFSDVASVLVTPTTDRQRLLDALEQVGPARNTSLASAVVTGVQLLPGREDARPPDVLRPPGVAPPEPEDETAAEPAELPPGSMLILSDGVSNVDSGPLPAEMSLELAARFAGDQGVKLYALALGREGGAVTRIDGQDYYIPFEPASLERLAEGSDGSRLDPHDEAELQRVFREMGRAVRWEATELEVSSLFAALAVALMLGAAGLGLRWQRRVP